VSGPLDWFGDWALSGSGLYYVTERALTRWQEHAILHLDFESGQVAELFRKEGPYWVGWLAVSPDEEWILYCDGPAASSGLMLVENFR